MINEKLKCIVKYLLPTVLVIGLVAVFSPNVLKAHAEESCNKIISVTGQAEVFVKPDVATIRFGVETNADTAQEAQKLNGTIMSKVFEALQSKNIQKSDIQTSNFNLYPVYEFKSSADRTQTLIGYRCNNTVNVNLKEIENIGNVIDAVVGAGATNVNSISFGVLDSKKYEDEMLADAVRNARTKAEIISKAAGVNITGISKISDEHISVSAYRELSLTDFSKSTQIEPGEVSIMSTVRIDFTF